MRGKARKRTSQTAEFVTQPQSAKGTKEAKRIEMYVQGQADYNDRSFLQHQEVDEEGKKVRRGGEEERQRRKTGLAVKHSTARTAPSQLYCRDWKGQETVFLSSPGVMKPGGTYSNQPNSLETECKTQIHTCYTSGVGVGVSSWCLTCCCPFPRPSPLMPKERTVLFHHCIPLSDNRNPLVTNAINKLLRIQGILY